LVVVEPDGEFDDRWPVCCINPIFVSLSDGIVGDDVIPTPPMPDFDSVENITQMADMMAAEKAAHPETFHYPNEGDGCIRYPQGVSSCLGDLNVTHQQT